MPVNKKGEDKMENAKVSNKRLMSLAILFVSALEMGGMGLQPALADIAAAFPDIPTVWMQEMSNWPGFAMLLGCALSTLLATKVSKKVLCQIGVGFVVAYAVLGFTLHTNFIQLMMWQTILGLGFGFLMPTSNGIIAENYAEDERGKLMGIQDLFTNGGGMYLTLIGGVLAAKAWNYTYLAFLYALIPLVLGCIYFPADKPAKASGEKSHLKIAPITWLFGAIIFVFINSYGVMGANISFIITERGMGTAALTGTAMAIFLVGGMFGGLIFSPFEKKLREYVLCCGFIALVIGFLIIYFAQSLVILFIGAFVVGTSIGFEMPGTLLYATNYNTVEASTAGCAVIHMAGQLGTVCSALFYTPVAGLIKPNDTSFRFLFAACVCAALTLLVALAVSITKKKRAA